MAEEFFENTCRRSSSDNKYCFLLLVAQNNWVFSSNIGKSDCSNNSKLNTSNIGCLNKDRIVLEHIYNSVCLPHCDDHRNNDNNKLE